MRSNAIVWTFLAASLLVQQTLGGEPCPATGRPEPLLQRLQPVGGWFPYGGGLLHWWPQHGFTDCGAPDDYCRKTLPRTCWPGWPCHVNARSVDVHPLPPGDTTRQRSSAPRADGPQ